MSQIPFLQLRAAWRLAHAHGHLWAETICPEYQGEPMISGLWVTTCNTITGSGGRAGRRLRQRVVDAKRQIEEAREAQQTASRWCDAAQEALDWAQPEGGRWHVHPDRVEELEREVAAAHAAWTAACALRERVDPRYRAWVEARRAWDRREQAAFGVVDRRKLPADWPWVQD